MEALIHANQSGLIFGFLIAEGNDIESESEISTDWAVRPFLLRLSRCVSFAIETSRIATSNDVGDILFVNRLIASTREQRNKWILHAVLDLDCRQIGTSLDGDISFTSSTQRRVTLTTILSLKDLLQKMVFPNLPGLHENLDELTCHRVCIV
jgi:hypothetical protein